MFSRAAAALIAAAAALLPSLDSGASIARLKFDPAAFAEGVSLAVEGMRIQSRAKAREARQGGRRDRTDTDRWYSDEYAEKILRRAENPDLFVPIEIKIAKPRANPDSQKK